MATTTQLVSLRGITARGAPSEFGELPHATTAGTDTTPSITESYITEVYIANNCTVTGIAILNGSAVAGNVTVYLADADGNRVANSASTAQAGIASVQSVPFTSPVQVTGPGTYYAVVQFDSTSARFRSRPLGISPGGKTTGNTYGTYPGTSVALTTFTAGQSPFVSTY